MGFAYWLKKIFRRKKKEEYHEIIFKEEKKPDKKELLLKELHNIGVYPETTYSVKSLPIDFAFPREKIIIEIIKNYTEDSRERDRKKYLALKDFGWSVYGFILNGDAESIKNTALRVKKLLLYHKKPL